MTESVTLTIGPLEHEQSSWGVSLEVFNRIKCHFPHLLNSSGDRIRAVDNAGDCCEVVRLLEVLQDAGVDVTDSITARPRPFLMSRVRSYSGKELSNVEYLVPHVKKVLGESTDDYLLDEMAIPHVKASVKPYKAVIGALLNEPGPVILVRQPVKERLEQSNLRGLKLVEPVLVGRRNVVESEKTWVVWSDLVLPAMKNILFDEAGNRFRWSQRNEFPHGCQLTEGYVFPPEPHYLRSDIVKVGDFDIALTMERFGGRGKRPLQPELIISQRFAKILFDELGAEIDGRPVRLDQDHSIPWVGPFPQPWEHLNRRPNWLQSLGENLDSVILPARK